MRASIPAAIKSEFSWTASLIKRLRGKRTLAEFGELIGVPKNTVWRWEAGYAKPDAEHAGELSRLAEHERFLQDWRLAGSAVIVGDLEASNTKIREMFKKSMAQSARRLKG